MTFLSPSKSLFYPDEIIKNSFNDLLKSIKQIKPAIGYFKKAIANNKVELINDSIFILIDLIIELDTKVITLVPEILSHRDEYSDHKLMRIEMYGRLGSLIKFGDRLLIHSTKNELQIAASENFIYTHLMEAIEDYADEVKKTVNISWDFGVDCADSSTSLESEMNYEATALNQMVFDKPSITKKSSENLHLSWCDDEHDIRLLRRRGFIRDSNTSCGNKTDSKETGVSTELFDSDLESPLLLESPDCDIMLLQSTWKEFVSSRYLNSSSSSPRITFRPSNLLPSKGKEIVFGSSYTVEMTRPNSSLKIEDTDVVLRLAVPEEAKSIPVQPVDANFIKYESVEQYLWIKTENNCKIVQGATVDALIVYACNNKQTNYTDAFITTYKSFIGSTELVEKLIYRFEYFMKEFHVSAHDEHYRIAKKTFALLLIIVSELIKLDLSIYFLEYLIDCTYRIIALAEIKLGRIFRQYVTMKIFEFTDFLNLNKKISVVNMAPTSTTNYISILDIKPEILAQQICLLTHEIINNIRSSELLLYIDKQDIEIAPHFSKLANLFNSISFWTATMILKENETRTRLRLFFYFIRVMRKLLEYENYESCDALYSALFNVSIYRIMPDIKYLDEFIELFDPSNNYKTYRERINGVKGPCIPILFLLIRDIIHIENGNPNNLHGLINFGKRYQIYNALEKFRNAKTNPYKFQKNTSVLNFVNNFQEYWAEDKLIEKSYVIKPRGKDEEYQSDDAFFSLLIRCVE